MRSPISGIGASRLEFKFRYKIKGIFSLCQSLINRMTELSFNLEFTWLPNVEEISEIDNILNSRQFDSKFKATGPFLKLKKELKNFCGFKIFIQDCKKQISNVGERDTRKKSHAEHGLFYLEFLYSVVCSAHIEQNAEWDMKRFVEMFFSVKHGSLVPELYLKYDPSLLDCQISICTEDKAKDLVSFSLGNFIGLNTYCERFHSSSSLNNSGYKITQKKFVVLHDYKKMILYFVVGMICSEEKRNNTTHCWYKLEIPYSSLNSVVFSKIDSVTVYMHMLQPPLFFSVIQEKDDGQNIPDFDDLYKAHFFRAIDLYEGCPMHLSKEFTMNTVLKLEFKEEKELFIKMDDEKENEFDSFFGLTSHCKNIRIFFAPISVVQGPVPPTNLNWKLADFECYYALECLLTHSYEFTDQLVIRGETDLVKKFLMDKSKENAIATSKALYLVFEALVKGNIIIFFPCLNHLYERLQTKSCISVTEDFSTNPVQPKHLLLIKRAVITPTHLLLLPPQPTLKSRALRDCDPGYSLRLSIKDSNMDTLNFSIKGSGPEMAAKYRAFFDDYFKGKLLKGLQIGKRCYKYVGSSTSQMKGHGLWYYAKDEKGLTADGLRRQFGQLEKITQVPKYMARMGQTFSQSMGHIDVPQSWTNVDDPDDDIPGGQKKYMDISDVSQKKTVEVQNRKFLTKVKKVKDSGNDCYAKEDDPYIFSDGVGRISMELAEMVYKELHVEESRPSAMQIRYAGCKGMLVVDPTLEGKQIKFRKSMKKFESKHESLEILKFSEKRPAFLNRPFITILEQLGISKEVFLKLQKKMIQGHITSFFQDSHACEFLNRHSLLRLDFHSILSSGFRFTEDPLFRSMIYAIFQKQIELLKTKASIEIPNNKGRAMFGVVDETGTLEYGEVFVQYSHFETDVPIVVKGTVVVTKNPCMHPGDVRKFEAIDVEDLHHIVDCIVFPAKGPRPHPDEMAGSDLDGDEYHVMWLKELTFTRDNETPMDFSIKKEEKSSEENIEGEEPKPIEVSDELDHLCQYIFNDRVGLIASAHLVWADKNPEGIFSEVCLRLAKQYSLALDFAKSGIPANQNWKDTPKEYPDFMGKLGEKRTYLSNKALGMLFRSCKRLELGLGTERNEIDYKIDNALVHPDWDKKYKNSALRLYKKYCEKVEFYLRTYGFESEGQLLSGALVNAPTYYQNRHDLDNLMALLEYEVKFIFKDLEQRFFEEFGGKPANGVYTCVMLQKASAWYMVTYSKSEQGKTFFGFPWAVSEVLVALKNRKRDLNAPVHVQSKTMLEEIVDTSVSLEFPFPAMSPDTDSNIIFENRLQVLDCALKILSSWVESQREYFFEPDIKKVENFINQEFNTNTITSRIIGCEPGFIDTLKQKGEVKKVISPCNQVIDTLLHIANIGATKPELKLSDVHQEVGLLAWMTLIKLACTYNPQYLAIPNVDSQYAKPVLYKAQDDIIDTIQLATFDSSDETNMKFSQVVTKYYTKFKEYFIRETKIKDFDYRHDNKKDSSYVRITVQGTRYSIERLKDIVVRNEFFDAVAEMKPLLNYM
ncbi:hypothetical protein JTE90_019056 [Oedothorax gibbosus]|uniref:RNA-directed RNA polymerase n=1 Tax=Oedothorax gibbosus TaxID=931172 RepID=A0AAV6V0C9_9ARAC|nr:hypothetical protein JTE90_019056 [Oedothorax gibbosus]